MKKLLLAALAFALPHFSWAQTLFFHADLNGAQAATASTGTGSANAWLDVPTNVLTFNVTWTGLGSLSTNAHIHRGLPGVSGPVTVPFPAFPGIVNPPGAPPGSTSGFYANTFTLTPALVADLIGGMDYVNIHSAQFPAGEIRGQLLAAPNPVPEPSTYALSGVAVLGLIALRRFRRTSKATVG